MNVIGHSDLEIALEGPWSELIAASERLATAQTMPEVISVLRETARAVSGADGIAVVIREAGQCFYACEDAMAPLWAGQRFAEDTCVSGWAMRHRQTVCIADVNLDARVPQEAYAQTFVRSMVMVPVGAPEPIAALGAYWSSVREQDAATISRLEALARAAAIALANIGLKEQLRGMAANLERRVEERTRELEQTQAALRQSQKLEAMGQLTGGVAHDFNNLLVPIMGGLDLLHRRKVGNEREQRLIDGALQSAHRAKILVQRLLAFARRQPLSPAPVDLSTLLAEMHTLLRTTLGPQITLQVDISGALPAAWADRHQVEMAILNLAVNARDAMPNGGHLTVTARLDEVRGQHRAQVSAGRYLLLKVTDDGIGMDDETRRRAVEPFFSTKGVGRGTGLGLSMVHGLLAQLGGGLSLSSVLGKGTSVELWVPVAAQLADVKPMVMAVPPPTTPGVVLLVDDEDLVRASTADMLGELGYLVIEARCGEEALQKFTTTKIDLLVTDHLMPSMSGADLARTVRARRPDIPILVISGYSDEIGLPADVLKLEKPFRQSDLAAVIVGMTGRGS